MIDKEKLEESRQHLENWIDYLFPICKAAVENDILGADTVGNIQRLLSDPELIAPLKIGEALTHIVMYHNERRPINGQLNRSVTLGATVSLDVPDVRP